MCNYIPVNNGSQLNVNGSQVNNGLLTLSSYLHVLVLYACYVGSMQNLNVCNLVTHYFKECTYMYN